MRFQAVKGSTNGALAPAAEASYDLLVVNHQVYHGGPESATRQQIHENTGLVQGSRIAIQDHARSTVRFSDSLLDQFIDPFVGHQLSRFQQTLRMFSEVVSRLD